MDPSEHSSSSSTNSTSCTSTIRDDATEDASYSRHEPLPNASNHIRLLEILSLDENEAIAICCRLTTFALENVPKYCAISYTWGNADDTTSILVNEKRMEVRQNCEYVLKQAKWYSNSKRLLAGRRRYFWCDAICIDQTNHSEKSFQVAMMGEIYQRAEVILCCIGEHDANSELIMGILHSKSPFLKAAIASRKVSSSMFRLLPPYLWSTVHTKLYHLESTCRRNWARSHDTLAPKRLLKEGPGPRQPFTRDRVSQDRWTRMWHVPAFVDPLVAFVGRPYFGRAWIYQELCFGSNIIVCCGTDRASLLPLRELIEYASGVSKDRGGISGFSQYSADLKVARDLVEAGITKTKVSGWTEAWLARHLGRVSQLDCTDDRDRVYAILSLIPWNAHITPIFPDYTRDRFDLGKEILSKLGPGWEISALVSWSLRLASRPSAALRRAVRARDLQEQLLHAPEPDPGVSYEDHFREQLRMLPRPDSRSSHAEEPRWFGRSRGFRLYTEHGKFEFEGTPGDGDMVQVESTFHYPPSDPEFSDQFSQPKIKVFLPMTAEPGDWCLFVERSRHGCNLLDLLGREWLLLIVRGTHEVPRNGSSTRFAVVGRGYAIQMTVFGPEDSMTDKFLDGQDSFEVFCIVEDALVLAASFVERVPTAFHNELLNRHLLSMVCGWPGSSFAIRSEDDQRSSEEKGEIEQAFWNIR